MPHGRRIALSLHRRFIVELMRLCRENPTVAVERRFRLGELAAVRRAAAPRPAWSVLFARAYALAAVGLPALRRSYFEFPRPHLYEHVESVGLIPVERECEGEEVLVYSRLVRPDDRPIGELDAAVRHDATAPLSSVAAHRRSRRVARLPWPLRGWLLRLGLRGSGRLRERHFGTFVVSSPAAQGAGLLHVLCPVTASVHYGLFDAAGEVDVRLTFDHRVFDGAVAARALAGMEEALRGAVCEDVRRLGAAAPAA